MTLPRRARIGFEDVAWTKDNRPLWLLTFSERSSAAQRPDRIADGD
jgi:hypothetical protein